jgi:3-oxoacyl-[acyl-carrier-protein] synthase III
MSRCVDCAQKALENFMREQNLNVKDMDLVITSQSPPGFTKKFMVRMGIRKSRMVDVTERYGDLHTAGPAAALEEAIENGTFAKTRNILFVTVGAGITVSMALYKNLAKDEGPEVIVDPLEGMYDEESEK